MVAEIKHTIELYIVTAGAEIAKELQHKYILVCTLCLYCTYFVTCRLSSWNHSASSSEESNEPNPMRELTFLSYST